MNPLLVAPWVLPVGGVVFLWAVIAGRSGGTANHARAFYSGLGGLIAIPVWLAAVGGLMMQLLWVTFASVAGVVFIISSCALVMALASSIIALGRIRRDR